MFIMTKRDANKVKDLLFKASANLKDKKQVEAIDAVVDLIDELIVEGRW